MRRTVGARGGFFFATMSVYLRGMDMYVLCAIVEESGISYPGREAKDNEKKKDKRER